MTITYPIDMPTSFGFSSFSIQLKKAVAVSSSVFTYAEQAQEHQGEAWEITGSLELLNREQAEDYEAFFLKLAGRVGTFTVAIPGCETPRGVATGTPLVNGSGQTGRTLITDGWTPSTTGILKAGDFIQLGTGSSTRLHKVLDDVDSDVSGNATFDIAPKIVTAPADNDAIIVNNAKGLFRLTQNPVVVNVKPPNQKSITFTAREVR